MRCVKYGKVIALCVLDSMYGCEEESQREEKILLYLADAGNKYQSYRKRKICGFFFFKGYRYYNRALEEIFLFLRKKRW